MSNCAIEPLATDHRAGLLPMIAAAFAGDDPLARSQGIGEADLWELFDSLYDHFIACGLSFVARDVETGGLAAVVLADELGASGEEGSDAIAALIDSARSVYFSRDGIDDIPLAHIHFIASDPAWRRQGLVQQVVRACLDEARERGFARMLVEASGNRSRALLATHFDFVERVRVDYAEFTWHNQRPFQAIAEHGGLSLMELDLTGDDARTTG